MLIVRRGQPFIYEIVFPDRAGGLVDVGPITVEVYRYNEEAERVQLFEQEVEAGEEGVYLVVHEDTTVFLDSGQVFLVVHSPVGQRRDEIYVLTEGGDFADGTPRLDVKFTR